MLACVPLFAIDFLCVRLFCAVSLVADVVSFVCVLIEFFFSVRLFCFCFFLIIFGGVLVLFCLHAIVA